MAIKVLFVCLGNICRSPTAHGVFQKLLNDAGLHDEIQVDSAGTGDWHIGRSPDQRSQAAALSRQYDLSSLRARQVCKADFETFDYILAMDECNLADLQAMHTHQAKCELALFLTYAKHTARREVPILITVGSRALMRCWTWWKTPLKAYYTIFVLITALATARRCNGYSASC